MTEVLVWRDDIESVWRPLTTREADLVPGLSAQAWRLLKAPMAVPDIEARMVSGNPDEDTVKDVMVWMIIRVLKNPLSASSVTGSIDDHSETVTLDRIVRSGELYISDEQLARLRPPLIPQYGFYNLPLGG